MWATNNMNPWREYAIAAIRSVRSDYSAETLAKFAASVADKMIIEEANRIELLKKESKK